MVPLVTKLQVTTTSSPTVEVISMSVMMPPKATESVPVLVPVVNSSKLASAGIVSFHDILNQASLASGVRVIDQLNSARARNQAANKSAESVAVVGGFVGFFGDCQAPAAGADDSGVRRTSGSQTGLRLVLREGWPWSEFLDGFKGHTDLSLKIALGSW